MAGITATIDASQFERKMKAADAKARKQIATGLNRVGTMAASKLRAGMPRDTTYMANHVNVTHATPNNLSEEITSAAKYTSMQDKGTKPFFPPTKALIESGWAGRHNKNTSMSDASFAFLVARAISKRGIRGKFFVNPVIADGKITANAIMRDALKGIWV